MSNASPEESIFISALEFRDESARASYLADACGADPLLRRRVEHLLAAYPVGEFLEEPVTDLTATALLPALGEQPGDTIGHYKLLEQIGEGGMGLVYMAQQSQPLRRRVALKIIKPGLDTRAVIARFEAERQALALMDHPNIARVFDAGATDSGRPYFVMELVRGAPITEYCREHQLPLRERLELFIEVCHAVQHAHQKGVIHRDLKPTNILVAQSDTAPVPKVIDFGVAKAIAQPLTERTLFTGFAQIIGTPLYMSPEQADCGNQDIDTRSDVYSLGVILYELLSGATPFDADRLRSVSHDEMRRILREEEPPKPSTRATTAAMAATTATTHPPFQSPINVAALQGDLDWIVMKALDKDRRRRYESPSAMAEDVHRYLANEVVEARRPSRRYQIEKFAQRHRAALALLTGLAALLVVMSVVGVSLAVRATRAEGLANARLQQVSSERNEKEAARVRAVAGEQAAQRARAVAEQMRDSAETARKAAEWDLYSSRMIQASIAWNDSDFASLQSLLNTAEKGADFRGWEWYFWDRQLRAAIVPLPTDSVQRAAWHPHRNELAVYVTRPGHRAAVEIWAPGGHAPIRTLTELPRRDDEAQYIRSVVGLTWSSDGKRLVYSWQASKDKAGPPSCWMAVVDVDAGREIFRDQPFGGNKQVSALALSPRGDALAVGTWYGKIHVWDVDAGVLRRVVYEPEEEENHTYLEFSPAGDHLAAAFRWGRRAVWNLKSGELFDYEQVGWGSDGLVRWSPDGKQLAATDSGTGVAIYEVGNRKPAKVLPIRGVRALCWCDARTLVVGGMDRWISTWDVSDATKKSPLRVVDEPITSLDLNHDGSTLLINGANPDAAKLVRVNRADSFSDHIAGKGDQQGEGHLLAWSRDGSRLASVHTVHRDANLFTGDLRVFDRATKQVVLHGDPGIVRDMVWTQDDSALLAFTFHGSFHEFAIGSLAGDRMEELPRNLDSYGASDFGPDAGKVLYTDGENVVIRDTDSLEIGQQFTIGPHIRQLRVSPNAQQFFVGSYNWWRFADVNTGKSVSLQRNNNLSTWIHSAAYSPDGKTLAAGVGDGAIELWQVDPPQLANRLVGHQREPLGVDWSNDGRRLASGAEDGTVRIWDVATGDPVAAFQLPEGVGVLSVQWSPNCRELAAGADNGDIYFFDAGLSFPGSKLPLAPTSLRTKRDENSPSQ